MVTSFHCLITFALRTNNVYFKMCAVDASWICVLNSAVAILGCLITYAVSINQI